MAAETSPKQEQVDFIVSSLANSTPNSATPNSLPLNSSASTNSTPTSSSAVNSPLLSSAVQSEEVVPDPEIQARFKTLASELRCLVCQNQSLADSQAGLAEDLKQKVYEQIATGRSDQEIKIYMVQRYGEFILYKPVFSLENTALWIGPFVILLLAVCMARGWLKKQKQTLENHSLEHAMKAETMAAIDDLYRRSKS
jgi:cytochrome c-type biogenesis protein CcmH